jgi:hypothetical protein
MQFLDLSEWAQSLLAGENADWGKEILDLIEGNRAVEWDELIEEIEYAVGHRKTGSVSNLSVERFNQDQAKKAIEGLSDGRELLEEIKGKLAGAGFAGDPKGEKGFPTDPADCVQLVLDKLEQVSDVLSWVRSPEDHAEAIADLFKLFPGSAPKPPKLEYDL